MDNPSDNDAGTHPFAAGQPAQHERAQAPGQGAKQKGRPVKLITAIVAVVVIAAIAAFYFTGQNNGAQPTTTASQQGGVALGSILSVTNSSADINVSYSGSAYISAGGNLTLPFTISMQRSGQNSTATVTAENMTLKMFKYGSLYYDCLVASNATRTCYNETAYAANYSPAVLASSATLVSQVLGNASNLGVSTAQRSYHGASCTFFEVNINGTDMSGCVSAQAGLVLNLSLRSSSSGTMSTYSAAMTYLGRSTAPSMAEFLNVSSSSRPGMSGPSLAYLNIYALAVPISALDPLILPEAAMAELGTFSSASYAPQPCLAQNGFYCNGAAFHDGTLSLEFGQTTGSAWGNTTLYFVPAGGNFSSSQPSGAIGTIDSGAVANVLISIPASVAANTAGASLIGTMYAVHWTAAANVLSPSAPTEVATLSLTAT